MAADPKLLEEREASRVEWRRRPRAKTGHVHSAAELVAYSCEVLSARGARAWTAADATWVREDIGEADAMWPALADDKGRRRRLRLREAVVYEAHAHALLDARPGAALPSPVELAALCVLCGDDAGVSAAQYAKGEAPGEVLEKLAKSLAHHRKAMLREPAWRNRPTQPKAKRRPRGK